MKDIKQSLGCSRDHGDIKKSVARIEMGISEFRQDTKISLNKQEKKIDNVELKIDGVKEDLVKVEVDMAGFKGKVLGAAGIIAVIVTSIVVPLMMKYFNNH